jgi:DhnA family fructose-bisphosphate aldolase class Ia
MGTRRLNHIFRPDGRTFIVAFDHGMIDGPAQGMEQPAGTLNKITAGGADAILTTYGTAVRFSAEIESLGLILRLDGGGTKLGQMGPGSQFYTVDDAIRVGADAVAVSAFPGAANEEDSLRTLAKVIGEAHKWGIPVMGEMVPGGFDSPEHMRTAESVAIASRIGAELGSNWVKIPYAEGFELVTASCYVPAVILGGAKKGSERTMLEKIRTALDVGAKGVAIGRNIFQADDPEAMTAAVAALIHRDISVDDAMKILKGS